jgi:hypothetical protein
VRVGGVDALALASGVGELEAEPSGAGLDGSGLTGVELGGVGLGRIGLGANGVGANAVGAATGARACGLGGCDVYSTAVTGRDVMPRVGAAPIPSEPTG